MSFLIIPVMIGIAYTYFSLSKITQQFQMMPLLYQAKSKDV